MDINSERARVQATVNDFDSVDKVVEGLTGGRCFENVEKGKARNVKDGVEFNLLVRIDCEKAPGTQDDSEVERAKPTSARDRSAERRKKAQERAAALAERRKKTAESREGAKGAPDKAGKAAKAGNADDADGAASGRPTRDHDDTRKRRLDELRDKRDALKRAREGAPLRAGPGVRGNLRSPIDVSGRGIAPMARPPVPTPVRVDGAAAEDATAEEEE
jgi:hypothetical protein